MGHHGGVTTRLPQVRGWPLIGIAPMLARDGPDAVVRVAARHGTPVLVPMGRGGSVLVAEPDHLRHVLVENAANYVRGHAVDMVRPLLGNGLPLADGPDWLRRRRLMQRAFGRPRLQAMVPTIVRIARRHAARLRPGEELRVHDVMLAYTRDVIVETMFSDSLGDAAPEVDRALAAIEQYVNVFALLPFQVPLSWPVPANRRFTAAIATLDRILAEVVARRRRTGRVTEEGDLLDALLEARDPDTGEPLPDRDIRDEVVNIFYAGHETTANALTWAVALLSAHPEVTDRLRVEASRVIGTGALEIDQVDQLTYASAVFRETIRLYPSAWIFARVALADDEIGGHHVPSGSTLLLCPYITHRLEAHWDMPEKFRPERFIDDPTIGLGGGRTAYFPFGAGAHMCIGNHLALAEAVVALTEFLAVANLRVIAPERIKPQIGATLGVAGGLRVRIEAAS